MPPVTLQTRSLKADIFYKNACYAIKMGYTQTLLF